ncbi:hypothetical protein CTH30272_03083 [Allocatenococcus thiocycli]|nr:hypothetical protein CTH30272_03083 [Catenococcus thiocycli]
MLYKFVNVIKKGTLSLLVLFTAFHAHAETNKVSVDSCGYDGEGKVVISSTICPQNNNIKLLYQIFPDLTLRALDTFGLDYSKEMVSRLYGKNEKITREERKLQIVSYYLRQMAVYISAALIIYAAFAAIGHVMKIGTNPNRHGRVRVPETILGFLVGSILIAQINGFYGFQWLIMGVSFMGIGLSQMVITSIAWMFQVNTSPNLLGDEVTFEYDATDEATMMTTQEVEIAVCISQLNANALLLNNGQDYMTRNTSPSFTNIDWSMDQDDRVSPMEVFDDSDNLIIAYGSGVASSKATSRDLNPKLCGKERVNQDKQLTDVVDEVDVDYSNAVEVFQRYAAEQLGKDELTTDNELEVTKVDLLRARFFRELMSRYRNPSMSDDRAESFLMSMRIAEKIRSYNCLAGDPRSKFRKGKSAVRLMKDGANIGETSLACVTNLDSDRDGFSVGIPRVYFDDEVLKTAEETQKGIEEEIITDIQDLIDFHREMITPIYEAFFDAGRYKSSDTQDSLIKNMIQQGLINAAANYIKLAMYTDGKVVGSTLVSEIKPDIQSFPLDNYYLPIRNALPIGEVLVSKIKSIPNSYNESVKKAYSAVGFENDLSQVLNAKSPLNKSNDIVSKIGHKINSVIDDAIMSVQTAVGFGYTLSAMEGSRYLTEAVAKGWNEQAIVEQYILRCIGYELETFNLEMASECRNMQRNPVSLMRDIGTQVFQAGATTMQFTLASSLTLSLFQNTSGAYGGISTSNSSGLKIGSSYVDKVGVLFSAIRPTLFAISIGMMVVGAIFALVLPFIPVFYMLILNTEFVIFVAIALVAGSLLIPVLFKPRIEDGHEEIGEYAIFKMCLHILIRPFAMFTGLVMAFIMTSVTLKLALYMTAGLNEQMLTHASGANVMFVALLLMAMTMYVYYKLIMSSFSKIPELANMITRLLRTSGFAIASSFSDKAVAAVGASILGVDKAGEQGARKIENLERGAKRLLKKHKANKAAREGGSPLSRKGSQNRVSKGNSISLKKKPEAEAGTDAEPSSEMNPHQPPKSE